MGSVILKTLFMMGLVQHVSAYVTSIHVAKPHWSASAGWTLRPALMPLQHSKWSVHGKLSFLSSAASEQDASGSILLRGAAATGSSTKPHVASRAT
jgi:hypothetical protein